MGGIKHGKWNMNPLVQRTPMPQTEDPVALAQWAAQDVQVNCKMCGHQILLPPWDGNGMALDPHHPSAVQWREETDMGYHKQCFMNYMMAHHMRQNGN